jgi:hypothetical protein
MIDPESAKKYKFFLGMKHEKANWEMMVYGTIKLLNSSVALLLCAVG